MTNSGISKSMRAHLADAAFHARSMHRSIAAAAAIAHTKHGERRLSRLARKARKWAIELDPETHGRRERRAA